MMRWVLAQFDNRLKAAFVVGLVPFFLSLGETRVVTTDGVQSCSHGDIAAIIGGALAIVLALVGAWGTLAKQHWLEVAGAKALSKRAAQQLIALAVVLVIALAAVQLLRGFGVIGGPCNDGIAGAAAFAVIGMVGGF